MDTLIGIFAILIGLVLVFSGLRVFIATLPLIGFVTGFFLGAMLITNWLGDGFLATATGWIVGLILAVLFAAISYMYWYIGALMASGVSGALIFSGVFSAFGVNNGILLSTIAIVGFIVFVVVALLLNLPVYIVLVNTAIYGSYMVIGGLLLLFANNITLDTFDWGIARAAVYNHWFWWLVLAGLTIAGIMAQLGSITRVRLPEEKWVVISR